MNKNIKKIRFNVCRCLWNTKKYIITCDIYVYCCIYMNCYELRRKNFDTFEQICLILDIEEFTFLKKAKEFNAEVQYNKYIQKNECLFSTKKDARKFINEYLKSILMLVYINNDRIDVDYIHNYK